MNSRFAKALLHWRSGDIVSRPSHLQRTVDELHVEAHTSSVTDRACCCDSKRTGRCKRRAADDVATQLHQLRTGYATQLRDLSVWCDAHDLKRQAEFTRNWLPRREPTMDYVFMLPDSATAPEKLVATAAARQWWDRFIELRQTEAKDLFDLAGSAAKEKQPALAFELVREAVREDPNHEAGRALLGQQLHNGRWVSTEAARRLQAGQVWSDQFGWLPADQVSQYEHGMRFYHGHWIDAAEDDRLHSNIYNGWHVESDHYTVITNHSLAEGVRLAAQLELLNEVWRQVFLGYYAAPGQVRALVCGTGYRSGQRVAQNAPGGLFPRSIAVCDGAGGR